METTEKNAVGYDTKKYSMSLTVVALVVAIIDILAFIVMGVFVESSRLQEHNIAIVSNSCLQTSKGCHQPPTSILARGDSRNGALLLLRIIKRPLSFKSRQQPLIHSSTI